MRSGLLARIRWSVCIWKSHRSLCESFSRRGAGFIIIIIIMLLLGSFSHQGLLMISHWILSDSRLPQVTRTLLSILTFLNNDVVCMVLARPPISNSSSPRLPSLWRSLQTHHLQLESPLLSRSIPFYFSSKIHVLVSVFFFNSFSIWSLPGRESILLIRFLLTITRITRFDFLAEIRWFVCIKKFQRILVISFSRMDSSFWIYHLIVWSNFNFMHNLCSGWSWGFP